MTNTPTGFGRFGPSRSMVQRERMIVLGGGTVMFSLLVIVALLIYSNSPVDAGQQVIGDPQVNREIALNTVVLVAPTHPVPRGEKLGRTPLREVYWPRDRVPEGAMRDIAQVSEMYARVDLPANQPLISANLSQSPLTFAVDSLLPPGHRAVSIKVDATSGIEGWTYPGAHVDVLLTYLDRQENSNKTRIVVEGAIVLSFDGSTRRDFNEVDRVTPAATITLAATTEDALKIRTAEAEGKISLVLRNPSDITSPDRKEFTTGDWHKPKPQPKQVNEIQIRGYAKFTDESGRTRQLILDEQQNWFAESALDDDKF